MTNEVQPSVQPKRDLYGILGVSRAASEQEIRSAFEKLASEFHASGKPRNIDDVEEIRGIAAMIRLAINVSATKITNWTAAGRINWTMCLKELKKRPNMG